MATKMVDLGVKRKDMYPSETATSPKSEKDYDKEKQYPQLELSGQHAEMMGAEDLKEGDRVRQTVEWVVKRHAKTTESGKTEYRMTLCLDKASDCEECEPDEKSKAKDDAGAGDDEGEGEGDESPAMAYIRGGAKARE